MASSIVILEVKYSHADTGHSMFCKRLFYLKDIKYVDQYMEYDGSINDRMCRVHTYQADSFIVRASLNEMAEKIKALTPINFFN